MPYIAVCTNKGHLKQALKDLKIDSKLKTTGFDGFVTHYENDKTGGHAFVVFIRTKGRERAKVVQVIVHETSHLCDKYINDFLGMRKPDTETRAYIHEALFELVCNKVTELWT